MQRKRARRDSTVLLVVAVAVAGQLSSQAFGPDLGSRDPDSTEPLIGIGQPLGLKYIITWRASFAAIFLFVWRLYCPLLGGLSWTDSFIRFLSAQTPGFTYLVSGLSPILGLLLLLLRLLLPSLLSEQPAREALPRIPESRPRPDITQPNINSIVY